MSIYGQDYGCQWMSLTSIVERTKAANGCKRWQNGPTTPNKYTAVEWEQVSGLMGLGEHYMYPLRASADPVTLQGAAMQNIQAQHQVSTSYI